MQTERRRWPRIAFRDAADSTQYNRLRKVLQPLARSVIRVYDDAATQSKRIRKRAISKLLSPKVMRMQSTTFGSLVAAAILALGAESLAAGPKTYQLPVLSLK